MARCVGGGSSVNFLMYTRASASDYDDWEAIHGNPGWGSKDLIPLAEKLETYQINPTAPTHGANGPLKISHSSKLLNVGESFLEVGRLYDGSRGYTEDVNDFHSVDQFGRWPKYIDQATGTRSDVAHHYIYDQEHNKNIHILAEARVKRVLFEGTKAVGVEWIPESSANRESDSKPQDHLVHVIRSSRLVVVSAGALGSPAILERSGIGSEEVLKKHDVMCLIDLKGVGEGYMDHNGVWTSTLAADETECIDDIFSENTKIPLDELVAQWKKDGSTLLAQNGIDAGIKLRPNANDLELIGPEFKQRWEEYFAKAVDKPILWMGVLATAWGIESDARNKNQKHFIMNYFLEYPISRGYAHISSGHNPFAPLDFYPGFLDE
jgi:alcohol oxidase